MITSLHSSHVEMVKALLGSRGSKARDEHQLYVVESVQNIHSLIAADLNSIKTLYFTSEGLSKVDEFEISQLQSAVEMIEVSNEVMKAMTDTVTPQGLLALVKIPQVELQAAIKQIRAAKKSPLKLAYFWQIQDPGNAGTVIRTADAFGFDAVIFSDNSVDLYGPKIVRSTAGSFWHLPLIKEFSIPQLQELAVKERLKVYATAADARTELDKAAHDSVDQDSVWIFGNESRGLPQSIMEDLSAQAVSIPISTHVESLNLATAAAVVMYAVSSAAK